MIQKQRNNGKSFKLRSCYNIGDVFCNLVPFVPFKEDKASNFTKSDTPPWVFFTFLKLYKCYQIKQSITFDKGFSFSHVLVINMNLRKINSFPIGPDHTTIYFVFLRNLEGPKLFLSEVFGTRWEFSEV